MNSRPQNCWSCLKSCTDGWWTVMWIVQGSSFVLVPSFHLCIPATGESSRWIFPDTVNITKAVVMAWLRERRWWGSCLKVKEVPLLVYAKQWWTMELVSWSWPRDLKWWCKGADDPTWRHEFQEPGWRCLVWCPVPLQLSFACSF